MATPIFDRETGYVQVTLTSDEMAVAHRVVLERHASQKAAWGETLEGSDGVINDIVRLIGEIAVMYAFGFENRDFSVLSIPRWLQRQNGVSEITGMEVRSVARQRHDGRDTSLIVRHDKDRYKQNAPFVLTRVTESNVIGRFDRTVTLLGWIYGHEAFVKENGKPKYWRADGVPRAYFVPTFDLRRISTLYNEKGIPLPKTRLELDAEKYSSLDFGV